jgi:phosphatidylserine/phosphatidylglycerophosphate/cardiolipin synthase-like enzyme
MPTLQELKARWFLDTEREGQFPPQTRHPGSQLQPYTDGNLVEPVIDGAALMAEFHERVEKIIAAPNPSQYELWVAQWKLTPVQLLGETHPVKDAETQILDAARAGVRVHFLGSGHADRNKPTTAFAQKLIDMGGLGASDKRIPFFGSEHQKFYVFRDTQNGWLALLGSADLNDSRWDTPGHVADNPDRSPRGEGPSHDVTVRVQGPAVHDIALTFAERWNDPANLDRTSPKISNTISADFLANPISPAGLHSVQVLRTYGIERKLSYSWAQQGEFTIWASYLNAIRHAQKYIYIEDQYFYSFSDPAKFNKLPAPSRDSDLVYQLGQAIKRGVDVLILVPSRKGNRNPTNYFQLYARRAAADYLRQIAEFPGAGRFAACYLAAGDVDPVIHAKVMLVDDEFALVGSANVCRRSMTYDSEVHVGVVDAENRFACDLRLALWQEHMDLDNPDRLLDPTAGFEAFRSHAGGEQGRLRLLDTTPGRKPPLHNLVMRQFMDPYKGPRGDK